MPRDRTTPASYYRLYGRVIASHFSIRCAPQVRSGTPSVLIEARDEPLLDEAGEHALGFSQQDGWFAYAVASDGTLHLRWRDLFDFSVAPGGRHVVGRSLINATPESFETYLLSQVLSCSFLRIGLEPIHATVIEHEAEAFAFLADSGYGKSTLAAACVGAGDRLVTDDLMLAEDLDGAVLVHRGPTRLKLFPEAAALLGGNPRGVPINDRTSKLVVALSEDRMASGPVPLRAIYLLDSPDERSTHDRITIRPMTARDRFLELTKGSFNSILVGTDRLRVQFNHARWLASSVPIRSLSYPPGLEHLAEVRDAVLRDAF